MARALRERLVGGWLRYAVSGVGVLLFAVGLGSILLDLRVTQSELTLVSALVPLSAGLAVVGRRVATDVADLTEVVRVLAWLSLGVLALALLTGWYQLFAVTADSAFDGALLFLTGLAAGGLFGAVAGYYAVRARTAAERTSREEARLEFLEEQQEALSTLNGILRHQILNDVSAITGRTELLVDRRADVDDAAATVLAHSDHIASIVTRLETISDVLADTSDAEPTAVGTAIEEALAEARSEHPRATFRCGWRGEATVAADHLLQTAIYEVLDNAAEHAGEAPTVHVDVTTTEDAVAVTVADDGPGIAVDPPAAAVEPSERGPESTGDGLGLFLAEIVLERYGGDLAVVSADGGTGGDSRPAPAGAAVDAEGAVVELRLPRT